MRNTLLVNFCVAWAVLRQAQDERLLVGVGLSTQLQYTTNRDLHARSQLTVRPEPVEGRSLPLT